MKFFFLPCWAHCGLSKETKPKIRKTKMFLFRELRRKVEEKRKSARARRKRKKNCFGLSHHNINMNGTDRQKNAISISLSRYLDAAIQHRVPIFSFFFLLVRLLFLFIFLDRDEKKRKFLFFFILVICTKTFWLIRRSVNVNFSRNNIAKRHKHRGKLGVAEFLW